MPTTDSDPVQTLEQQPAELKAKLAEVGDLRPGSLLERYRRCGKAGCHCAARRADPHVTNRPPIVRQRRLRSKTSSPMCSMTTSTPRFFVKRRTSWRKSCFVQLMP